MVGMPLEFRVAGCEVSIACDDLPAWKVLQANFAAMPCAAGPARDANPAYAVRRMPTCGSYLLSRGDTLARRLGSLGSLLHALEQDLVVELQHRRPDLLFLHAAALERDGRACLLAGASGDGKSTTAFGLLHRGWRYLSDELAPVDVDTGQVHAYPHALCLKRPPPASHPLPVGVLDLGATLRVPVALLPGLPASGPSRVAAIVLVRHDAALPEPVMRRLGTAEAAARLYTAALNPLAHRGGGLDAAVRLASRAECFLLRTAALDATCRLLDDGLAGRGSIA